MADTQEGEYLGDCDGLRCAYPPGCSCLQLSVSLLRGYGWPAALGDWVLGRDGSEQRAGPFLLAALPLSAVGHISSGSVCCSAAA
jgi:hypothetical protein